MIAGRTLTARIRARADIVWYGLLSAGLALLAVALLTTAASARSEFCHLCHAEQRASLEASPHADQSCNSCHDGTSYARVAERRIATVQMLVAQVMPGRDPASAQVDSERCRQCHRKSLKGIVASDGIKMSHRAPDQKDWSCSQCHGSAVHPGSPVAASYTMEHCLSCHSTNPSSPATCETCHEQAPDMVALTAASTGGSQEATASPSGEPQGLATPWEVTHGPRARELHGMGDLDTCAACHIPQFCASCHKVELPHPSNQLATHGPQLVAGKVEEDACFTCHQRSACETCHGLAMPHPESFLQTHPETVADSGEDICRRCHSEKACQACHERHVHPGVRKETLDALRARPVD